MTKIAIQGVHGCFHEQAARLFYGNEIDVCECLSFEDLFAALDQGKASGAIMAIENTVAGGLLPNYSLLHKHSCKVKGEVFLRIQQNLMALPGQTIEEMSNAFYDLNLTKIQSLPIPGKEWQYFFYVDLKFDDYGHYLEAMNAVRPLVDELTVMGEYKSYC